MYANVTKTKVFFIATPASGHDHFRPGTILAGLDESGRKPQWTLPYAVVTAEQIQSMGLFSAAVQGIRKHCGPGLQFAPLGSQACINVIEPITGEILTSIKRDHPTELHLVMTALVNKGKPNAERSYFQGVDFYDLDSPHSDLRLSMLPKAQIHAITSMKEREAREGHVWYRKTGDTLKMQTIRNRLETMGMIRPHLIDGIAGKPQLQPKAKAKAA